MVGMDGIVIFPNSKSVDRMMHFYPYYIFGNFMKMKGKQGIVE